MQKMPSFKLKSVLIALLATILIVACQNKTVRQPSSSQLVDCRTVEHAIGEVCVPKTPQRLVSLDNITLADALALEISSVGASLIRQLPSYLNDKLPQIEFIGKSEQPNLEKIFQLNPDLIVGIEMFAESIFQQLSQIAPTAVGKWSGHPDWREHFNFVARVLNKENEAKTVWENYNRRIEELKIALGGRLKDVEVSVAYTSHGTITIYAENSFSGSILADLGIHRPKNQAAVDKGIIILSEERIPELDGDILFVSVADEESKQVLAKESRRNKFLI